jgi:4-hydroxy-tetrahydrodipicolinate synthase
MTDTTLFSGILPPVLTPFDANLAPDAARFVGHCRWLLEQGATGLAPFGTTGEGNSLSVDERLALLEAAISGGIDPALMMPGTGCTALSDSVRLTRGAVEAGCGGVLMLPPFFYKGVSDDALFRSFAEVIERIGDTRLKVYLYHIPPQAQLGFSLDLIARLLKAYPGTVVGLKDSSGDWSNTKAIIDAFPGFATFSGSEVFLLHNLRAGGVGCITASGNVNVAAIRALCEHWQDDSADARQAAITKARETIQAYPLIPALKAIVANHRNDDAWTRTRPPLLDMPAETAQALLADLRSQDFALAA